MTLEIFFLLLFGRCFDFLLDLRFSFTYNLFNCGTYETLSKIKKS